jgi:hypothetical protein
MRDPAIVRQDEHLPINADWMLTVTLYLVGTKRWHVLDFRRVSVLRCQGLNGLLTTVS